MVIFCKIVLLFLVEINQTKFHDVTNKETNSCDTVVEVIYYELGVIIYLDGAAIILLNYLLVFII